MAWRPHPKGTTTDATSPEAWAVDDRSGMVFNRARLRWQYYWRGNMLQRIPILVSEKNYDKPNQQARAKVLSPDPLPIRDPRPENFVSEMYGGLSAAQSADPPTPVGPIILDD